MLQPNSHSVTWHALCLCLAPAPRWHAPCIVKRRAMSLLPARGILHAPYSIAPLGPALCWHAPCSSQWVCQVWGHDEDKEQTEHHEVLLRQIITGALKRSVSYPSSSPRSSALRGCSMCL